MGLIQRVVDAVMTWLITSAGRKAHLAIKISEVDQLQAVLKRAGEMIASGDPADVALGRRLQDAVGEAAVVHFGDHTDDTTLLVDYVAGLIAQPSMNGNGRSHQPAAITNGHAAALPASSGQGRGTSWDDIPEIDDEGSGEVFAIEDMITAEESARSESASEQVPPPRKRGRPRKNAEPSPAGAGAPSHGSSAGDGVDQIPARRKRGRPRKVPAIPEDTSGDRP